jgi:hypothetical protein
MPEIQHREQEPPEGVDDHWLLLEVWKSQKRQEDCLWVGNGKPAVMTWLQSLETKLTWVFRGGIIIVGGAWTVVLIILAFHPDIIKAVLKIQ